MVDVVPSEVRSRMMAGIRGKNTAPERLVRSQLFARGFRYRLHDKRLPGKPDLVFPRYRAVVFVHGCFWHAHDCALFKLPSTRQDWWRTKLEGNRKRDLRDRLALLEKGWRVAIVWECALSPRSQVDNVADSLAEFLKGLGSEAEYRGEARISV